MAEQKMDREDEKKEKKEEKKARQLNLLAGIAKFKKTELKPTETVVRTSVYTVFDAKGSGIDSAIGDPDAIKEYFDEPDLLAHKSWIFADYLKKSRHAVFYTGAGVSTSANLPDYRGPKGVWTMLAKGYAIDSAMTCEQAAPTYTHMAICELVRRGFLQFIVSTNVDGLHRRSGLARDTMAELHGNIYREYCERCSQEYLRPFDVTTRRYKRYTGRLCEKGHCNGKLRDSIINFGENLPQEELERATFHSEKADFTVVLGSSMRVSPACELPALSYKKKGSHFCIINLQKTPYDEVCEKLGSFRVFSKLDEFFKMVMDHLKIAVPPFSTDAWIDTLKAQMDSVRPDPNFKLYLVDEK